MPRLARWFIMTVIVSGSLILLYGRVDRWILLYCGGWALFALLGLMSMGNDLVQERFHPPEPGADRLSLRAVRIIALSHMAVGALDAGRWQLAPVSDGLRAASLALMFVSSLLVVAAMHTNRFFSAVVRIQTDRGHHVVDRGPYATIRHPGYLGMIASVAFSGLALGSWLGFGLGLIYCALILRRVAFEDAYLATNLPGYRDYTTRVKYRLIPGAW